MAKYLPIILLFPLVASAQPNLGWVSSLLDQIGDLIGAAIPIAIALGLLLFIWGLVMYIGGSGDRKEEGKNKMIWGVLALFIMVSVWGIVAVLGQIFNVSIGGDMNDIPGVNLN